MMCGSRALISCQTLLPAYHAGLGATKSWSMVPLPEGTRIARADVADFTLRQMTGDEYLYKVPALTY